MSFLYISLQSFDLLKMSAWKKSHAFPQPYGSPCKRMHVRSRNPTGLNFQHKTHWFPWWAAGGPELYRGNLWHTDLNPQLSCLLCALKQRPCVQSSSEPLSSRSVGGHMIPTTPTGCFLSVMFSSLFTSRHKETQLCLNLITFSL